MDFPSSKQVSAQSLPTSHIFAVLSAEAVTILFPALLNWAKSDHILVFFNSAAASW